MVDLGLLGIRKDGTFKTEGENVFNIYLWGNSYIIYFALWVEDIPLTSAGCEGRQRYRRRPFDIRQPAYGVSSPTQLD